MKLCIANQNLQYFPGTTGNTVAPVQAKLWEVVRWAAEILAGSIKQAT